METTALAIAGIGLLVLFGALLASVDGALSSLGEMGLSALRDSGGKSAKTAELILRERDAIQARYLAGRALCLAGAVAMSMLLAYHDGERMIAFAITAVVALAYSVVVEISSTFARLRAGSWAVSMFRWMRPIELLFWPVALPIQLAGKFVEKGLPEQSAENSPMLTELAVEHIIDKGEESGDIDEEHADLLRSVLEFKDTIAREVMIPRTRVVAFDIGTPLAEVLGKIIDMGHSRYPVYENTLDQIVGILYAKDLFRAVDQGVLRDISLASLLRKPAFFVSETQKISSVLSSMQTRRSHLSIATDEFGGTAGVLTLEDIIEEIVGEIEDEHDSIYPSLHKVGDKSFIADAAMSLHDLQDMLQIEFVDRDKGDFDSLGGYLISLVGNVPAIGTEIEAGAYSFVVRDSDEKSISSVEIKL